MGGFRVLTGAQGWLVFVGALVGCGSTAASTVSGADASLDDAGDGVTLDGGKDDVRADGSAASDAPDSSHANDASTVAPIPCGQTLCRVDQTCTAGKCAFACTGATVPGDYATIQAAADALAPLGQNATICLSEKVYFEPKLSLKQAGASGKTLRIVGLSMDRSTIQGSIEFSDKGWGALTLQGVHIDDVTYGALGASLDHGGKISLVASRFTGSIFAVAGLEGGATGSLFIDGSVLDGPSSIQGIAWDNSVMSMTVQNSYLHGCNIGTSAQAQRVGSRLDLRFVNDTVVGCDRGLMMDVALPSKVVYANNVITGATTFGVERKGTATDVTHGHDALWGNASNYSGGATDGPGTVKADCLLGTTGTAPKLGPASPCRGAGDPTQAPSLDFYGVPRGAQVDLGAVQSP